MIPAPFIYLRPIIGRVNVSLHTAVKACGKLSTYLPTGKGNAYPPKPVME
ncbi:hypothetical protein Tam1G_0033 [Bifidobacterium imperatoris]|uniref:Uncharacterized protein n=1 Tax=Bifidobacterium imperatoris TaxID=2020965 RepID=A0A2N5IV98_9BIFI|nr:hypothetical protein Tam1G_0033 [Bifidobacterium imperatoris]